MLAFTQRFSFANEYKEFLEGEFACYRWVHVLITLSGRELIWILF